MTDINIDHFISDDSDEINTKSTVKEASALLFQRSLMNVIKLSEFLVLVVWGLCIKLMIYC